MANINSNINTTHVRTQNETKAGCELRVAKNVKNLPTSLGFGGAQKNILASGQSNLF